jgi:anoctamin-10
VYLFGLPYSSLYSSALLLWSITFVEWWRIQQRILSVRWGTRGSFRVEKRRAQYTPLAWWRRELRVLVSVPVILLFAAVLVALLTVIFVFEAFVTHLYKGPGVMFIVSLSTLALLFYRLLSGHSTLLSSFRKENKLT